MATRTAHKNGTVRWEGLHHDTIPVRHRATAVTFSLRLPIEKLRCLRQRRASTFGSPFQAAFFYYIILTSIEMPDGRSMFFFLAGQAPVQSPLLLSRLGRRLSDSLLCRCFCHRTVPRACPI